jgi:hypothetical protein
VRRRRVVCINVDVDGGQLGERDAISERAAGARWAQAAHRALAARTRHARPARGRRRRCTVAPQQLGPRIVQPRLEAAHARNEPAARGMHGGNGAEGRVVVVVVHESRRGAAGGEGSGGCRGNGDGEGEGGGEGGGEGEGEGSDTDDDQGTTQRAMAC